MIKRTLEISREGAHLSIQDGQLLIARQGERKQDVAPPARVPLEDLGFLVVDHRETTYTHSALAGMVKHGAVLVVCGEKHLPDGLLLPLSTHTEVVWRVQDQIDAGKTLQKRLWTRLVVAKIRAQASNLSHAPDVRSRLLAFARKVRSGDPDNAESQAARVYWPVMMDLSPAAPFRRDPGGGHPPNNFLDYGYAVVRAAVARALVASGLFPAIGIHHSNRGNPFCLADDLIEPLRPLVDARTRQMALEGLGELDQPAKARLLELLTATVRIGDSDGPLMVALSRYTSSLARSLEEGGDLLEIPVGVSE